VIGAPRSLPVGHQRVEPEGSSTAPDRICAPTSTPFPDDPFPAPRRGPAQIGIVELLEPDRRRQARRPRAHDDDVVFHRFAFDLLNIRSPLARALIGKDEGDSVEVRSPGGERSYEIVSIRFI
jgi:hypothetical protein